MSIGNSFNWATTDAASKHYGVSLRTLQRWALADKIPYKREAGRSYYGIPSDTEDIIVVPMPSPGKNDNEAIDAAGSVDKWLELVKERKGKAVLFEPTKITGKITQDSIFIRYPLSIPE
jgi:hypothetical protein